jgi:hypothetical protein
MREAMIARVDHRKVLALAAVVAALCVLLLATLFVSVQQVQTTVPGANTKVASTSERGDGTEGADLTRNTLIERHLEMVARYNQGSLR